MLTTTKSLEPPRLAYMDWLRSTDMLFVLLIHCSLSFLPNASTLWPIRDVAAGNAFNYLFSFIYIFNMPCFFFMAGFFASQIYFLKGINYFFTNRMKRVMLPFCIVLLLLMLQHTVHWIATYVFAHIADTAVSNFWQLLRQALAAISFPQFYNNTASYWFMYYLLILYLITHAATALLQISPLQSFGKKLENYFIILTNSVWKPLLLALPATIILFFLVDKFLPHCWYLIPPLSFKPELGSLLYYGLFFWFGWFLRKQQQLIIPLSRHRWIYAVSAIFIIFPLTALLQNFADQTMHPYYGLLKILALFVYPLGAWLFIFAMTGIFFCYFNQPNKIIRYLADASYWVYLTQVPLVFYLQEIVAPLKMFAVAKFLLIFLISGAILLLTYHRWARFTIIGETLNGVRYIKN